MGWLVKCRGRARAQGWRWVLFLLQKIPMSVMNSNECTGVISS